MVQKHPLGTQKHLLSGDWERGGEVPELGVSYIAMACDSVTGKNVRDSVTGKNVRDSVTGKNMFCVPSFEILSLK